VLNSLFDRLSDSVLNTLFNGQCVAQFWWAIGLVDAVALEGDIAQFQAPAEKVHKALRGCPPGRSGVLWAGHIEPERVVVRVVVRELQVRLTVHLVEPDDPARLPIPDGLGEVIDVKPSLDDAPWREARRQLVWVGGAAPVVIGPGL